MSRCRIEHITVYTYHRAVAFGRHRLVLRPREGHDLRVESMALDITPAHRVTWARDVYNNSVAIVDLLEEAARLEFRSRVIIQRSLPFPREDLGDSWRISLPVAYDLFEEPVVAAYRAVSYPEDFGEVRSWLEQFPEIAKSRDAEAMLITLCSRIASQFKYQRREHKGVQTPAQTLRLGSGSCRDMATLMMDAARALGMSARFASGYVDCPAAEAGRATMHAWTEVYLPLVGWRGFDPSMGEPASLKQIAVGVSHHPRGVMPISGTFNGTRADYIEMVAPVRIERIND